jgi:hypothetical protein
LSRVREPARPASPDGQCIDRNVKVADQRSAGSRSRGSRLFLRRTADGITERASLDDDSRRVLHVTFGSVLADGALADRFGELREQYAANLEGPLRQPPAPVRLMEPLNRWFGRRPCGSGRRPDGRAPVSHGARARRGRSRVAVTDETPRAGGGSRHPHQCGPARTWQGRRWAMAAVENLTQWLGRGARSSRPG